ncbi:MAG: abortive infection system antitoxin AbiGi family protein [Bacteroidia bacterium]
MKSILITHFQIKYCLETIETKSAEIDYAVPMSSFCDIPLSQVISHIDKYGGYGIGLHKRWAKRKGLNPVLYLEKNSNILNDVLIREKFENNSRLIQEFLRYTKNYEGKLVRGGEIIQKSYRYFDEREWRFCPNQKQISENEMIIHDTRYYRENKSNINERVSNIKLTFTTNDLSYLIVKDDDDIIELINFLEQSFNSKEVKMLTSKILTSKQIRSDF